MNNHLRRWRPQNPQEPSSSEPQEGLRQSSQPTAHQPSSGRFNIRSLDIFGQTFSLSFFSTSGRFQTQLGGYVTIIMVVIGLALLVFFVAQYFQKDAPVVTTSSEFGSQTTEFDLSGETLYPIIGLRSEASEIIPASEIAKYVTLVAEIIEIVFNPSKKVTFAFRQYL